MSRLCPPVSLALLALPLAALTIAGCGEVEALVFPERPVSGEVFAAAQDALITVGCSFNGGCHTNIIGNFQVTPNPKGDAALDDEFQITKPFIDLNTPIESELITVALVGAPGTHTKCFADADACAVQKIVAWLEYSETGNSPAPADIDCQPIADACFSGL